MKLLVWVPKSMVMSDADRCAAETVLSSIVKIPDKHHKLLLGCFGETMRHGDQRQGAVLLQRVLDKFNYKLPAEIDTCTLLRCTARLLMSLLSTQDMPETELLERLCSIFKAAARFFENGIDPSKKNPSTSFPSQECEWFLRNSYNMSMKNIEIWPTKYVLDLLAYSGMVSERREPDDFKLTSVAGAQERPTFNKQAINTGDALCHRS
jgi:hypothetical protein